MSRENPNGEVVLYVEGKGAVVATADVLIRSEIQLGALSKGFRKNTLNVPANLKYQLVGMAKTTPTTQEYTLPCDPEIIDEALKYTRTKFFRLMIDLMKLAQFDPFNGIPFFGSEKFRDCSDEHYRPLPFDIDFSATVPEIDAQLYRKYGFTPAMIDFVERKYSYDNGAGVPQQGAGEETRGSFHTAADDVSNGAHAGNARIADER